MENKGRETKNKRNVLFAVLLFGAFGLIQCQSGENKLSAERTEATVKVAEENSCVVKGDMSSAISAAAERNVPAVAHIEIKRRVGVLSLESLLGGESPFDEPRDPEPIEKELRGVGSGVILDGQGRILTNNHVVAGAIEIKVFLSDGRSFSASVVGTDGKTDLAVIRIDAGEELPHVVFGNSDRIEVGDWVIAIGHPRGLDQTVTQGIISAKGRRGLFDPGSYQDYLQTDAAINPGSSGGPLLNLNGEVIGVNSAIASGSGGFEGIGFAIPSNVAVRIANALISDGKVRRGWLGVSIREPSSGIEGVRGIYKFNGKGVLVSEVSPESPAAYGGIEKGDIIRHYNGQPVEIAADLQKMVAETLVGEQVEIDLIRRGKPKKIVVGIESLDKAIRMLAESVRNRIGGTVRPITMEESQRFGLPPNVGVAVESVEPSGLMEIAGFENGDIILGINNQLVESVESFAVILHDLPPEFGVEILALDSRNGQTGYVELGNVK